MEAQTMKHKHAGVTLCVQWNYNTNLHWISEYENLQLISHR